MPSIDLNNVKIHYVDLDDWVGLYVNGELWAQGHSLKVVDVLEWFFSDSVTSEYIDDFEGSYLPEKLEDLKTDTDEKDTNT